MKNFFLIEDETSRMGRISIVSDPEKLEPLIGGIEKEIARFLVTPTCPMEIAKKLGTSEQRIYYHIRKMKSAGIIEEVKSERRNGAVARFYRLSSPAFGIIFDESAFERARFAAPRYNANLEPFIKDGKVNFTIVVGSPEPHGPFKARASDSMCAIDLALFLGSFTEGIDEPNYKIDVEMREKDLKKNLILIGGPVANMITRKLNMKMPIRILLRYERVIYSAVSKKRYVNEYAGYTVVINNPWSKGKKIIILAGKRFQGTRAAVLFFIKRINDVFEGNRYDKSFAAHVVMGYDINGDGVIDTAELIE